MPIPNAYSTTVFQSYLNMTGSVLKPTVETSRPIHILGESPVEYLRPRPTLTGASFTRPSRLRQSGAVTADRSSTVSAPDYLDVLAQITAQSRLELASLGLSWARVTPSVILIPA